MRVVLPSFLIHSILVLTVDAALEHDTSRQIPQATTANEVITTPLTLWDLGFSLKERWADLREQEECPVPPDLICVEGGAECGDQQVLDTVASSLHPSETGSAEPDRPTDVESARDKLEEDLVSFEDWKRKKLEQEGEDDDVASAVISTTHQAEDKPATTDSDAASSSGDVTGGPTDSAPSQRNTETVTPNKNNSSTSAVKSAGEVAESPKPPTHNKYNYASPDCSARIHSSSPSTQHASSLLHKSRDRYMLTPCKADEHWVVVELCDEIRIEAIEIAVWEFFSGVIRDVRVSVGGAEDDDDDEEEEEDSKADSGQAKSSKWEEVGSFVGKNVRGVQTFTLPQPTSFHRFMRLDFPSFYGTEYYCPVSQVKVYGMNQMEAFKWEQKRLAANAKDRDREKSYKDRDAEERRAREKAEADDRLREQIRREDEKRERELDELEKLVVQQAKLAGQSPDLTSLPKDLPTIEIVTVTASSPSSATSPSTVSPKSSSVVPASNESSLAINESAQAIPTEHGNSSGSSITSMTISSSSSQKSSTPRSDSSESIYAQIVRRLNALEGNSSLVARYIEEQAKVMRLMLGRVERGWEDWRLERELEEHSRWEQERMRQEDRLGAVISQMEQQRVAIDFERRAILAEIRVLSEELGHERRRGIAQLVIILTILAIGAATRSSAIDAVLKPLMVEARRRRSVYKSFSGPLAGLAIDMGSDRPPAVIGQPRPPNAIRSGSTPVSIPNGKAAHSVKRSDSGRRPITPRKRHPTGVSVPQTRVFSDSAHMLHDSASSPFFVGLKSPKSRGSLPTPRHGLPRKLARSAHLHTMEADRVRRDVKARVDDHRDDGNENGDLTPRRPRSVQYIPRVNAEENLTSPSSGDGAVFSDSPEVSTDIEHRSDWDTDAEGAISEIDGDLRQGDQEVVQELLDIWAGDDRPSAPDSVML